MEKFYTVSKKKTGSWLWHRPWTPYSQIQTQTEESSKYDSILQKGIKEEKKTENLQANLQVDRKHTRNCASPKVSIRL